MTQINPAPMVEDNGPRPFEHAGEIFSVVRERSNMHGWILRISHGHPCVTISPLGHGGFHVRPAGGWAEGVAPENMYEVDFDDVISRACDMLIVLHSSATREAGANTISKWFEMLEPEAPDGA